MNTNEFIAAYEAVIARIDLGTPYMADPKYVAGAEWVKSQIIEVLMPAARAPKT